MNSSRGLSLVPGGSGRLCHPSNVPTKQGSAASRNAIQRYPELPSQRAAAEAGRLPAASIGIFCALPAKLSASQLAPELREMPGFLALAPNFRARSSRCSLLPATAGTWSSPSWWGCSPSELIHPPHICIPQMMPNKYSRYINTVVSTYMPLYVCVCTHPSRRGAREAAARGAGAEQGAPGLRGPAGTQLGWLHSDLCAVSPRPTLS